MWPSGNAPSSSETAPSHAQYLKQALELPDYAPSSVLLTAHGGSDAAVLALDRDLVPKPADRGSATSNDLARLQRAVAQGHTPALDAAWVEVTSTIPVLTALHLAVFSPFVTGMLPLLRQGQPLSAVDPVPQWVPGVVQGDEVQLARGAWSEDAHRQAQKSADIVSRESRWTFQQVQNAAGHEAKAMLVLPMGTLCTLLCRIPCGSYFRWRQGALRDDVAAWTEAIETLLSALYPLLFSAWTVHRGEPSRLRA